MEITKFSCPICGKEFSSMSGEKGVKSSLMRHCQVAHKKSEVVLIFGKITISAAQYTLKRTEIIKDNEKEKIIVLK